MNIMIYVPSSRVGKSSLQRFFIRYYHLKKSDGELQRFRTNFDMDVIKSLTDFEILNDMPFFEYDFDRILLENLLSKNFKFILLYRNNLFESYISAILSKKISKITNNKYLSWGTFNEEKIDFIKNNINKIEIDIENFKTYIKDVSTKKEKISIFLKSLNIDFIEISYESIYTDEERKDNIKNLINYIDSEKNINEFLINQEIMNGNLKNINRQDKINLYKNIITNYEDCNIQ